MNGIIILLICIEGGGFSYNIKGNIRVMINGDIVKPENINCYRASGDKETESILLKDDPEAFISIGP